MTDDDKVQLGTTPRSGVGQRPLVVPCSGAQESAVAQAVQRLLDEKVVALPTETVYGLAGMASSPRALESIFEWKRRPVSDPLILHVFDISSLDKWTAIDGTQREQAEGLAARFWPGPLTLVLEARQSVHSLIRGGHPTVALRSPSHPFFRLVLQQLQDALAAPSANVFGHISPTRAEDVVSEFPNRDLLVFDGGPCDLGIESTIVRLAPGGSWRILRPGVITEAQIREVLNGPSPLSSVPRSSVDKGNAPGQFLRHYSPNVPTFLLGGEVPPKPLSVCPDEGPCFALRETVVLDFGSSLAKAGFQESWCLSYLNPDPEGDLRTYTKTLFSELRRAENVPGAKAILIHFPESFQEEWSLAIRDRIHRAASGVLAKLSAQAFA